MFVYLDIIPRNYRISFYVRRCSVDEAAKVNVVLCRLRFNVHQLSKVYECKKYVPVNCISCYSTYFRGGYGGGGGGGGEGCNHFFFFFFNGNNTNNTIRKTINDKLIKFQVERALHC